MITMAYVINSLIDSKFGKMLKLSAKIRNLVQPCQCFATPLSCKRTVKPCKKKFRDAYKGIIVLENCSSAMYIPCNTNMWVGFTDTYGNCSYTWLDSSSVSNNALYTNNVKPCAASSCGISIPWLQNSTLSQQDCSSLSYFVCQYRLSNK